MQVKLIGKKILENAYSEEQLSDLSTMESVYLIRQLKAVIDSDGEFIEVDEKKDGYVYSEKYQIGFHSSEYIKE